jgi:hypothetical protein
LALAGGKEDNVSDSIVNDELSVHELAVPLPCFSSGEQRSMGSAECGFRCDGCVGRKGLSSFATTDDFVHDSALKSIALCQAA